MPIEPKSLIAKTQMCQGAKQGIQIFRWTDGVERLKPNTGKVDYWLCAAQACR